MSTGIGKLPKLENLSAAELLQHINDRKGLIDGYRSTIDATRSTIGNPTTTRATIDAYKTRIALDQKRIDQLEECLTHGFEKIEGYKQRIAELDAELRVLFNYNKILQMVELQRKLTNELGDKAKLIEQL